VYTTETDERFCIVIEALRCIDKKRCNVALQNEGFQEQIVVFHWYTLPVEKSAGSGTEC